MKKSNPPVGESIPRAAYHSPRLSVSEMTEMAFGGGHVVSPPSGRQSSDSAC